MPIIRKLIPVGGSKAVTIPRSWIQNAEENSGKKMIAVTMEVNGNIIIKPLFEGNHVK